MTISGLGPTFKVTQDVFAGLGVQTGADEREDRNLLHLLFVSWEERKHYNPVTQKGKTKHD